MFFTWSLIHVSWIVYTANNFASPKVICTKCETNFHPKSFVKRLIVYCTISNNPILTRTSMQVNYVLIEFLQELFLSTKNIVTVPRKRFADRDNYFLESPTERCRKYFWQTSLSVHNEDGDFRLLFIVHSSNHLVTSRIY